VKRWYSPILAYGLSPQRITSSEIHPFFAVREAPLGNIKVSYEGGEALIYKGDIIGGRWIDAAELAPEDILLGSDGTWLTVENVSIVEKPLEAYNLSVAETDSFFAGGKHDGVVGVWVHNCKGMNNPKVKAAAARGREAHKEFAERVKQKPGWQSEKTITGPNGEKLRPDALTPSGRPVELKPNTPSGRRQGAKQIQKYKEATGKNGRVIYYNP